MNFCRFNNLCNSTKLNMLEPNVDYISAGGNRHPSAADWNYSSGILAYGTDRNIALWSPLVLGLIE